jgi:hypothetical protein
MVTFANWASLNFILGSGNELAKFVARQPRQSLICRFPFEGLFELAQLLLRGHGVAP